MAWQDDLQENIRFGLIEIIILALLSNKEMYGYKLKHELYERSNGVFKIKEGSLYGPLYRMQQRNLISSHREIVEGKRFRNYYRIEEAGKEYLEFALRDFKSVYSATDNILTDLLGDSYYEKK